MRQKKCFQPDSRLRQKWNDFLINVTKNKLKKQCHPFPNF